MVAGGTHPREKTDIDVTPIGGVADTQFAFDTLSEIFYNANAGCLTPFSDFAAARFCTADVFGEAHTMNVHEAWDAVGVPYLPTDSPTESPVVSPPPTPSPTHSPSASSHPTLGKPGDRKSVV